MHENRLLHDDATVNNTNTAKSTAAQFAIQSKLIIMLQCTCFFANKAVHFHTSILIWYAHFTWQFLHKSESITISTVFLKYFDYKQLFINFSLIYVEQILNYFNIWRVKMNLVDISYPALNIALETFTSHCTNQH